MRKVERFQCELCNKLYLTEQDAIKCENLGKELPIAEVGQEVEYELIPQGFNPFYITLRISKIEDYGHYLNYSFEEYYDDYEEWCEFPESVYGNDQFKEAIKIVDIK